MKGLLLAGGHGTRLRPLTFTGNKHMLPIANKPMLFYGLEHMGMAEIKEVGIVLGPIKEGVVQAIGDGSIFGIRATYIDQPEPKGLAHAVMMARDFLGDEPFVMYLGDNLLKQGATPLIELFQRTGSDCAIGVSTVKDPRNFGIVEMDSTRIKRLIEKPRNSQSNLALVGVYVFNSAIFDAIKEIKPSWRDELEITDAIQVLLDKGRKVSIQQVQGWWKDTGKPEDLLEANQLVLQDLTPYNRGTLESSVNIYGNVALGDGTIIRKETTIRGPVIIGRDCEIGPGSYIGPYTSIGDHTKIIGGEVENSIVMENVTINCGKRIIDSLIGSQTTIVNSDKTVPRGYKLIIGERTFASI